MPLEGGLIKFICAIERADRGDSDTADILTQGLQADECLEVQGRYGMLKVHKLSC